VAAAVSVPLVAKLIARPDGAFYWKRRIFWRSRVPESNARNLARSDRPFCREKIGRCGWKNQS
jgi:hypothetical protein